MGKAVTYGGMSGSAHFFHILMLLCTGGLWAPRYLRRYAHARRHVTVTRWS